MDGGSQVHDGNRRPEAGDALNVERACGTERSHCLRLAFVQIPSNGSLLERANHPMDTAALEDRPKISRLARRRFSFESVASRSVKYRPDVDGLRAVAVLAVVFYHLGIEKFPNGYVGVDIFYVISGYLITSLLARDLAEGKFSLVSFYERRMRRIFPALFTVLFFSIVAAAVLLDTQEMTAFGKSLLTTTLFISNFYFWHSAMPQGYFDTEVRSPVLLHTWSLSVEEQFYLLFPLTLYVLFRWARKSLAAWLFLLGVLSFGLNLWTTQHKPVIAFYWSIPRAWELLAGALLAVRALPLLRGRILREIAALLGLAMVLIAVSLPIQGIQFPGWFVLLPCLGTCLVIYAGEAGPSLVAKTLSFRPIVFVGVISYSLYLWHWPLIVFSRHLPFRLSFHEEIAVVLVGSVAAAFLSFEFVERPFRGSGSRFSRRQIFAFGFATSAVCAALGWTAYRTHGLPVRYDARTSQLMAANLQRIDDYEACSNWKSVIHSLNDVKSCTLGEQLPHKVLFWGDSHTEQLYPAVKELFNRGDTQNHGVVTAFADGCPPDEHINTTDGIYYCDARAKFAILRAEKDDIDTVFIGFAVWWRNSNDAFCLAVEGKCVKLLSGDDLAQRFEADLSDEIGVLKDHGKRVIICLPFPAYMERIPELAISNAVFGRFDLSESPTEIDSPLFREEIRAVALRAGADVFDPRETLCPGGHCITEIDGVSIYKDSHHIAASQVHILEDSLREALQHALAERTSQASPPGPKP